MFNNSTKKADDLRTRFTVNKGDDNATDGQVRAALNDFYSILGRLEREYSPEKFKKTTDIVIPLGGFDLSTIEDIGNMYFKLYQGSKNTGNFISKRFDGSQYKGFFLEGKYLYLTFDSTDTFKLTYNTKTTRILPEEALTDHTLEIDQDLERALYLYFQMVFFDGEYQLGLRDDAEAKAIEEIQRYFDRPLTPRGI